MFVGTPTWPNHPPIIRAVGLGIERISLLRARAGRDPLRGHDRGAARRREPGDVALLHGCCHNPTGADLERRPMARSRARGRRARPAAAHRHRLPGLRPRARRGCVRRPADARRLRRSHRRAELRQEFQRLSRPRRLAVRSRPARAKRPRRRWRMCSSIAREMWSMPPDHGAACGAHHPRRSRASRALAGRARRDARPDQFGPPADRRGRPAAGLHRPAVRHVLDAAAVARSRCSSCASDHAIYMADSGRFNVVGMGDDQIDRFIAAVVGALDA